MKNISIKNKNIKTNTQSGQAIITAVVFFLTISLVVIVGISTPIANQIRSGSDFLQSKQGYIFADSLNEEAFYRLNKGRTLPASFVLPYSSSSPAAAVTDVGGMKQVIATGIQGALSRVSKSIFSQGEGVSINYGLQVGNGGLTMSGSPTITGNVYSNGNISGSGSASITGSASAAVATTMSADQINSATGTPAINTTFGTTTASQDIAQSFTVSTSTSLAQARFYIKKNGSPSNATVKIVSNSSGSPSNSTPLASATLSASNVTTSYGWVSVSFTSNPSLTPGTTYWIVVDVSSNSTSNYYIMGTTNGNNYSSGQMKVGSIGGSWTIPNSSYDEFFEIYLGGVSTIDGMVIGGSGGNARAFTVTNSTVSGSLYCQSGSGNNKSCDTSQPTPSPLEFPYSDNQIQDWKDEATALGVRNSSLSVGGSTSTTTSGMKIVGNLTVSNSGELTLTGPLYVTGNVTISGSAKIKLASSYGASSEFIVADGLIDIGSSGGVLGSGTSGSYIVFATTNSCGGLTSCSGSKAISVSGSAGAVVLLAKDGGIDFQGSAGAKGAVGYSMTMSGSTNLVYETGLADIDFLSGPSGSWNVSSWKEIAQ